jgi:hypothetical protein
MRREGYIIEEIIDYSNMSESFDEVLRGKKRKRSRQGRYLLAHREEVIKELTEQIANGSFRVSGYRERTIHEYGKERNLQILSMKDRIGVHAIMSVVDRHLQRRYIRTTAASIKERGTHDLMKVIRQDMQHDPEGTLYAYKFDIRHFYENVRQDFAMWCYRRVFKDQKLLVMLESFVTILDSGISFGLRSSQATGNLLLSVFLDHNVEFIEQEDNWERPAVFVELCPINWEATVAGMRYVTEAKVNLHVVTDWLGSSAANSDQREESLTVFDLLEKIHTALADVDGEHFREFDISNSTTNHNHEDILENIETYSYVGYRELDLSK